MSYPYPPPQQPQGYYPPPPGAGAPYGAPPPGYCPSSPQPGLAPPLQGGYRPPSPYGGPPPPLAPPSPVQGYAQPLRAPSPLPYGAPPQGYGPPQPYPGGPPPPQGYGAPQPYPGGPPPPMPYGVPPQQMMAAYDPTTDIQSIMRACKGLGTDEAALTAIFAGRTGPQIDAIRNSYLHQTGKDLIDVLASETSGSYGRALKALALGPTESEVFWLRHALQGAGTQETLLTEALVSKSNAHINALKTFYHRRFRRDLTNDVRADLSGKTAQFFSMVLSAQRMEEYTPVTQAAVIADAHALHKACKGLGTDETTVSSIMTRASDGHIRALDMEYQRLYSKNLSKLFKSEFSGHLLTSLLFLVEGALDRIKRDAERLEHAMKGVGTKDTLLIARVVRGHWDKGTSPTTGWGAVKAAYRHFYGRDLADRVKGETSGDYGRLMVELCRNN